MTIPSGVQADYKQLPISQEKLAEVQNRANATKDSSTSAGSHSDAGQRLDRSRSDKTRTVSILENTYHFNEGEAKQISAFAEAISSEGPKTSVDVKPGFLTKIKLLCVKILAFFRNQNKDKVLQREGLKAFEELKKALD